MFEAGSSPANQLNQLKRVLLTPAIFFEEEASRVDYRDPVIFLLGSHLAGGIVSTISRGGAGSLISYPVFGLISVCLVSIIVSYILGEIFDVAGSYGETFRIIAYSSSVVILSPVPLLGFLAALYGLYLIGTGIMKVHKTTFGQAMVTAALTFFCMNILRFLIPWIVSISPFGLFT